MCGIAAYFGPGPFDPACFLHSLAHRGPDASGAWSVATSGGNRLHLIQTRLAIIDLTAAADQPMCLIRTGEKRWRTAVAAGAGAVGNGTIDYAITYNGEIYNYRELRGELEARGHHFGTSGDTEILLRGYAEWGQGVFARLDGMFAAVIYDGPRRGFAVGRDHAGIKPLYFGRARDGGYLFASEVRAITASGMKDVRINQTAILDYLRFGSFQEPATAFAGIWAFEPGSVGWIGFDDGVPGIMHVESYWEPAYAEHGPARGTDWLAEHRDFLRHTVTDQLIADVPVGIFLSGGLDSTLLLELAAAGARDRLTAFTLGGELTANQEGSVAARTAANLGVRHLQVRLTGEELHDGVRLALRAMDQPSSDGVNTFLVSRASRAAGLVVVLGGTGADELHGAYGYADDLAGLIRLNRRFGALAQPFGRIASRIVASTHGVVAAERLTAMLEQTEFPWRVLQEKRRFFTTGQIAEFWPEGGRIPIRWHAPLSDEAQLGVLPAETQIMLAEVNGYLRNTLLRDSDWATMANQQELRVPYLGRRYMELMLRMPPACKAPDGAIKKPLLAALISPANRALVTLPKQGFTMNYAALLLGPLREEFQEACGWLNANLGFCIDARARLAELDVTRSSKFANRLWALFALGGYLATHARDPVDARVLATATL